MLTKCGCYAKGTRVQNQSCLGEMTPPLTSNYSSFCLQVNLQTHDLFKKKKLERKGKGQKFVLYLVHKNCILSEWQGTL